MHISSAAFILTFAIATSAASAQAAPGAAPADPQPQPAAAQPKNAIAVTAPGAPSAPINTPSSLLKPSLATVQDTLNSLRVDRWKKGSVRDEAGDHVTSLLKDLQTNLPPLIANADAAPGSVSQALPLTKHLDAFYAVLLRVEEAARVSAPSEQIPALQQALLQLNQARLALDDQLQTQAAAQEKLVADLQASLKVQQQAVAQAQAKAQAAAVPPPCKPATPAKKKPAAKKPATNASGTNAPATTTPAKPAPAGSTPAPGTSAKPSAGQTQGQQNQPQGQKQQQNQPQGQKGQPTTPPTQKPQ
jgi:hypothetical protein